MAELEKNLRSATILGSYDGRKNRDNFLFFPRRCRRMNLRQWIYGLIMSVRYYNVILYNYTTQHTRNLCDVSVCVVCV